MWWRRIEHLLGQCPWNVPEKVGPLRTRSPSLWNSQGCLRTALHPCALLRWSGSEPRVGGKPALTWLLLGSFRRCVGIFPVVEGWSWPRTVSGKTPPPSVPRLPRYADWTLPPWTGPEKSSPPPGSSGTPPPFPRPECRQVCTRNRGSRQNRWGTRVGRRYRGCYSCGWMAGPCAGEVWSMVHGWHRTSCRHAPRRLQCTSQRERSARPSWKVCTVTWSINLLWGDRIVITLMGVGQRAYTYTRCGLAVLYVDLQRSRHGTHYDL